MLTVKQFTFSPLQENTYVVYNEKVDCCIIDPGCSSSQERKELKEFIQSRSLRPKYLLNTHCHLDHIFGNQFIHQEYKLPLHLHPKEKKILDFGTATAQLWGLPYDPYEGELVFIDEQNTIELGAQKFEILFTPGHSPGSICFYCKEQKFVVGGDVLFQMSIGRTDLPGGNFDTLISSIRTQLFTLPDDVVVYPGHGPQTSIGYEKKHNPFLT